MKSGNPKIGFFARLSQAASIMAGSNALTLSRSDAPTIVQKGIDSMGGGFQGVPAYWFARAIEVGGQETLFEPFKNSVWVQRAIKKVSGPISSVELVFLNASKGEESGLNDASKSNRFVATKVWTKQSAGGRAQNRNSQDFISLPDVAQWLEEPAPGLSWSDFVAAFFGWLKLRGESFWVLSDEALVPFPEARATKLPPIIVARPDRMRHIVENGILTGWAYTDASGKAHALLPDQVIQTKEWNPYNEWRGLGEYESAQIAAEGDWLAGKFSRNLMANNGDTGPFIIAKSGVPTDAQREQIIADLKAKRQAQLRGDFRPIFMSGDISVEDPKVKTVDTNFSDQRLDSRHEIAAAFGVPMSMFDVKNDYSMGSQSAYYQLILDTCIPGGAKLCDALERLVYKLKKQRYEIGLLWDEHPVLQTVRRERMDALEKLLNRGVPLKDASDYLALDLPRVPGDDVGYLPINVMPVSEASQPEPEPSKDASLSEEPTVPNQEVEAGKGIISKAISKAFAGRKSRNHLLWEKKMRQRAGTVRAYQSKVNRILNEFRAKALRQLASHGGAKSINPTIQQSINPVTKSVVDFIFDAAQFGKELVLAISPVTKSALEEAVKNVADEIGTDSPWEMPPAKALEFIRSREQDVQNCGKTVRDQLNTALKEGYEAGESTDELEARVKGVFNNLSKAEARRIAVTETGHAFNFATHQALRGSGIKYKRWLSSHGPNVRPAHQAAEAAGAIPMDEPFEVGEDQMDYPGDDSYGAGTDNIINCQCVQIAVAGPEE